MPYETLEKISYRQPGQYEAIYEARLNGPETVRLDFEVNGWPAFVVQNSDVYRILLQIQKIDKQVQLLCKELPRAALRQFAQNAWSMKLFSQTTSRASTVHAVRSAKYWNKSTINLENAGFMGSCAST